MGAKLFTAQIVSVREYAAKEAASEMYRVISGEEID